MSPRLARGLLTAGLLGGAALAAWPVLQSPGSEVLPDSAVARVGDRLILRDEWLRAVAAVASERRTPLDAEDRAAILERLIDEALLVQYGVALGLMARDPRLRGQLVDAVMQVTLEQRAETPDAATLRAYYAANAAQFQSPSRWQVSAVQIDADGRPQPLSPALPTGPLPLTQVRQRLGPALAAQLATATSGETLSVTRSDGARLAVTVEAVVPGRVPDFESVESAVRSAWQRDLDERLVRDLLDELRVRYAVVRSP